MLINITLVSMCIIISRLISNQLYLNQTTWGAKLAKIRNFR